MTDSDTTRIGGRGGDVERARRMAHAFERLAVGEEGWSALLRDPSTSALWEQTWPHSEEHGGGPIVSGERERAIGLPASAGLQGTLSQNIIEVGTLKQVHPAITKRLHCFSGRVGQARTVLGSR